MLQPGRVTELLPSRTVTPIPKNRRCLFLPPSFPPLFLSLGLCFCVELRFPYYFVMNVPARAKSLNWTNYLKLWLYLALVPARDILQSTNGWTWHCSSPVSGVWQCGEESQPCHVSAVGHWAHPLTSLKPGSLLCKAEFSQVSMWWGDSWDKNAHKLCPMLLAY